MVTIGPDGIITDVNASTENATGLPREKLIGTDFSDYFTEPERAQTGCQQVFRDGKVYDYELKLRHVNGNCATFLYNATVYKDIGGTIIGAFAAARDITAIRKADDELMYMKSNLELLVKQRTAELLMANKELDYEAGEKSDRAAELLTANKELDYEAGEKSDRAAELLIANKELAFQNEEKEKRAAELLIANKELAFQKEKFENLNNQLEYRVIQRTAQLESANRELEALSYSISHDLKAPLRHITGYVTLLSKRYKDLFPEEGRRYLDNISLSAMNMGELIEGLLQFSRTGRMDMNIKMLNMNEIVEHLIQPTRDQDTEHRIEFSIDPLPPAFGDLEMIKSVWNNYIENAVKFTRKKDQAKIQIGSEQNENEIIYFIKDNGAGFDMKYASKLFAVFQRLHSH